MGHTPGPWKYNGWERVLPANGPQDGPNDICHVYQRRQPGESCDANARLIAAAPELLAVLEAILKCDQPEIIDAAYAAIAKAKGGAS